MPPRNGYFTMGLDAQIAWPSVEQQVQFRGHTITLRPETKELSPSLVVALDGTLTAADARRLSQEFLSGLAWLRQGGVTETFSVTCSAAPMGVGKGGAQMISDAPIEHVPAPDDPRAKLALALYREAISVNLIPYQVLGFFKVINVLFECGAKQREWISRSLPDICDTKIVARIADLRREHDDVAKYLYESGRCAVAHAFAEPVVNPDEPEHVRRLAEDLPLLRALAELAIEKELRVRSYSTILAEHLYELEGFRQLISPTILGELKAGRVVPESAITIPRSLSLRLRGQPRAASFEAMHVDILSEESGVVALRITSSRGALTAVVHLCFVEEQLLHDAMRFLNVKDDESVDAALCLRDARMFFKHWMANGVVEIWDPQADVRLGRSAPVMLVNMMPDFKAADDAIAEAEALIASRRNAPP